MEPSFALSSGIRDAVKTIMEKQLLDHMAGAPTTENVDHMQEKVAKMAAGVQTTAKQEASGKYGYLHLVLANADLAIATNNALTEWRHS